MAESFHRIADEQSVKSFTVEQSRPGFWGFLNDWRVAFAGMAAVMLLGAGLVYIALRSSVEVSVGTSRNSNERLIGYTETREPSNVNEVVVRPPDNSGSTTIIEVPKGPPQKVPSSAGVPAPVVASFTLLPGALRDDGEQSINVNANTGTINLRLSPPKDTPKYKAYSATLKTADGETIIEARSLKRLHLSVPARKLSNRTYIVFLEGTDTSGKSESVAEYTFRVRR